VLWYYGVFTPGKWAGEQIPEGTAFKILAQKISTASSTLTLGNKYGQPVQITSVDISGAGTATTGALTTNITAGANANVTTGAMTWSVTPSSGDLVSLTITITYTDMTTGLSGKKDIITANIKVT
jgi:hypothetical protein